ncbi:beta-N-acetylhexosaminidase [Bacteroidota bacterium]
MTRLIYFGLLYIVTSVLAHGHNPILPQPQKVKYGKGKLSIADISITFKASPDTEDRFAADELAGILSEICGKPIRISESESDKPSIIFERTGNVDPLPLPNEKTGPDSREAYQIIITTKQARIISRSSAGLFYAIQTLRQMVEGIGKNAVLPECEVEDWPAIAYRGFMMDMSHTQLPLVEEIKRQIDFLARWKSNQYYFYSEASIELDGYPLLMANARYTKKQVKEVIDYARVRHIDVIPNMELYGHLHDLFRLEHYADLSVVPHGGELKPYDPRVKPIIDDWISQIAELFPSPFFHIGFDETWLIRSEAKKLNLPPETLYLKMLRQTTDMVEQQNKIPLVWADMLQKYPSIIPQISEKTIVVPWHYFPKDEKAYDPLLKPFSDEDIPMIVQSALINWNWVYPSFNISFENTALLLKVGKKYNSIGFINSGWTDDTQTIMRMSWPDLAYGSAASWQSMPIAREKFFSDYAQAQYPEELAVLVEKAHRSLVEGESLIRKAVGNTDPAFFANPFTERSLENIDKNKQNLRNGRLAVEVAQIHLREAIKQNMDTITLFAMLTGAKMLDYIALKYIYAGEISDFWEQLDKEQNKDEMLHWMRMEVTFKYHTRTQDMLDAIIEVKEMYEKAWLNEYTTFRLGVGVGKYDLEFQYWLKMQRRMDEICRYYDPDNKLPSLESLFQ